MTVSPQWVSAGAAVAALSVTVAAMLIRNAFSTRDEAIRKLQKQREDDKKTYDKECEKDTENNRETARTLFGKIDENRQELADYKLHVAETYVNQAALEKLLGPIERRLESIEEDIRSTK